jgi:hypothetical protein
MQCGQNVQLLNVKLVGARVTRRLTYKPPSMYYEIHLNATITVRVSIADLHFALCRIFMDEPELQSPIVEHGL